MRNSPKDPKARMPDGPTNRLFEGIRRISANLHAVSMPLAAQHGLGERGLWALSRIAEGDVYPGDIGKTLMIAPSLVTHELNRLIASGLAMRTPDEFDRRKKRMQLTPAGRDLIVRAHALYEERVVRRLEAYDPNEIDVFFRVLDRISEESWSEQAEHDEDDVQDMRARLEALERENRQLRTTIQNRSGPGAEGTLRTARD